jgi:hypothetical protein
MPVYKIHPAVGIARVGDSPDAFFVGPEKPGAPGVELAPGGAETPITQYKSAGRIKRQGARFRVYQYDKDTATGDLKLVGEVPAAKVEWKVDLVNRKAALNHSLPTGIDPEVAPRPRNTDLMGSDRDGLIIRDPRERKIRGPGAAAVKFDQAEFRVPDGAGGVLRKPVPLGELHTDGSGRLIVLGGHGVSGSLPAGLLIKSFANNDRWHDDVSDGPVTATVTVNGTTTATVDVPADVPAWVIVAPPDFAPGIAAIVTLYDVLFQAAFEAGFVKPDPKPSFSRHILPVIQRASNLRFVNQFGLWSTVPTDAAKLAQTGSTSSALRQQVFDRLVTNIADNLNDAVIPDFLATYLDQYRKGDFLSDLGAAPPATTEPDDLDRAALEACVGLNFFPGIEGSQNLRDKTLYGDFLRFKQGTAEVFAGFLTEIMAVPWQADFLKCQGQWWPSQRPDFVMTDPNNIPGSKELWAACRTSRPSPHESRSPRPFVVPAKSSTGQEVFIKQS